MNLPSKVNIVGIEYQIDYFDNTKDIAPESGEDCIGYCLPDIKKIRIYNNGNESAIRHALWHEIIESIKSEMAIDELSEENIDRLALALNMLVKL